MAETAKKAEVADDPPIGPIEKPKVFRIEPLQV
jgi:hypothetical protein